MIISSYYIIELCQQLNTQKGMLFTGVGHMKMLSRS